MVDATRHLPAIAALEAAIPDAAALVFACLGIALALHGRRALRARTLNLAAVGTSVMMNVLAAEPGWRNLAIWALPPVAYALASDTLISVVRALVIARHQHLGTALAADAPTPLAILGGLALWLLRLALAPASTLAGFRAWVLAECPVAPGRRARPAPPRPGRGRRTVPRKATKTGRFLDQVTERHGSLAQIPLRAVAGISADLAPLSACTPAPPAPPCARPSWPPGTEPPDDHQVRHRPGHRAHRGRRSPRGRSCPPATCPVTGPATCGSGSTCGCIRARASPTSSACGCAGAASRRCAGPRGSAPRSRFATGSWTRASTRSSSAAPTTGTACASRSKSTSWSWPRRAPIKTAFLADVILRYPGPVIATTTKADLFKLTSAVRSFAGPVHVFNPQHIGGVPSTFCSLKDLCRAVAV